jgi:hypothetical protein
MTETPEAPAFFTWLNLSRKAGKPLVLSCGPRRDPAVAQFADAPIERLAPPPAPAKPRKRSCGCAR